MASISYYDVTASATSSTSMDMWSRWNQDYATTTTSTSNTTWAVWSHYTYIPTLQLNGQLKPSQLTPEQLQEQASIALEREEQHLREAAEQRRIAEEAEHRAEALLREHLDSEQTAEFEKRRSFTVISKDGGRRYQIRKGSAGNIIQRDGQNAAKLCAHAPNSLPDFDHMLIQKLWLEADEDGFLKVANKTPIAA